MKNINKLILLSLLLISTIGCNNSKNKEETNSEKSINVSVSLAENTQKKKETEGLQLKSFQTDVQTILLQVYTQAPVALVQTKAMTKNNETGSWNIDLILNSEDEPFNFNALAYDVVVTPETLNEYTPIFTGRTSNVSGSDAVIVLTETNESINASIRKLPILSSVDSVVNNNVIDLTFNFENDTESTLTYALTSVANEGAGATCASTLFTSATGTLAVEDSNFTSTLIFDPVNCESPKYFLTFTTNTNDNIKIPFTLNVNLTTVSIARPPLLSNINIIDNESSYSLEAQVTDTEGFNLSYAWSVVNNNGKFNDDTANPSLLNEFDRENALEVLITVKNIDTTASSSLHYQLLGSSILKQLVTREELITMMANGEDVSNVDTSTITDMSYQGFPFFPSDFNQDISGWDTSAVTNMYGMFYLTSNFNQNISTWNTSAVTNMYGMFYDATSFNQNISKWNVSNVTSHTDFSTNAPLTPANTPNFP